jgi:NAD(P)-dependent dehydrogenase (short-subunit alcohol dehydrogenase family)
VCRVTAASKGIATGSTPRWPTLNDGGSIIVNSADADAKGAVGAYAAITAALRSLAPTWASELRERKIRVNVISPDATETPGINALAGLPHPGPDAAGEQGNYQRGTVPPAHHATAREVADAALFLAASLTSLTTMSLTDHEAIGRGVPTTLGQ